MGFYFWQFISVAFSLYIYCWGFSELLESIYLPILSIFLNFHKGWFLKGTWYIVLFFFFQSILFWSDWILFIDLSSSSLTLLLSPSCYLIQNTEGFLLLFLLLFFVLKFLFILKFFYSIIYYFTENFSFHSFQGHLPLFVGIFLQNAF